MAIFGIDTSEAACEALRKHGTERLAGSANPRFWGRYFNGADDMAHQYLRSENSYLYGLRVPVLCYARQMWAVGDDFADVAADHATKNMRGVADAFGSQYLLSNNIVPRLYLDIETDDKDYYILSKAYYVNWSAQIMKGLTAGGKVVRFRPAVYLNLRNSKKSVLALNAACFEGAVCDGVWPAHYIHESAAGGPPEDTNDKNGNVPPPMSDKMRWETEEPRHDPFPHGQPDAHIPKHGWQYFGDYPKPHGDVDFNMINPAYEDVVMKGMVMPPPA